MGQRIKLKAISPSIDATGVFGPKGEYPVGTILTLPDNVPFIGSGYERHELLDGEKTADHEAVTNPATSGTDGGGADKDAGQTQDADLGQAAGDGGQAGEGSAMLDPPIKKYSAAPTDSPGWWVITDETGAEVKKVRPADGTAFNDLDDAGKAAEIAKFTA